MVEQKCLDCLFQPERIQMAHRNKDKDADVVLCYLPRNKLTPWVTWLHPIGNPRDTFWGHYHYDVVTAVHDFEER